MGAGEGPGDTYPGLKEGVEEGAYCLTYALPVRWSRQGRGGEGERKNKKKRERRGIRRLK